MRRLEQFTLVPSTVILDGILSRALLAFKAVDTAPAGSAFMLQVHQNFYTDELAFIIIET